MATVVSVGRTLSAVRRLEESVSMSRVATLGASNAVRTVAALGEAGVEVIAVCKAGWRPSVEAVEAIKEELGLEMGEYDVLVIQCLDSSCLYVMNTATGGLELP